MDAACGVQEEVDGEEPRVAVLTVHEKIAPSNAELIGPTTAVPERPRRPPRRHTPDLDLTLGRYEFGGADRTEETNVEGDDAGRRHTRMWARVSVELAVGRAVSLGPIAFSHTDGPVVQQDAVGLALDLAEAALGRTPPAGGLTLSMLRLAVGVARLTDVGRTRTAALADWLLTHRGVVPFLVGGAAEVLTAPA
jgi:hypothetical protein